MGASRGRVVRYLLVESGLLAIGAAIVAIVIAYGGMQLLQILVVGCGTDGFPGCGLGTPEVPAAIVMQRLLSFGW